MPESPSGPRAECGPHRKRERERERYGIKRKTQQKIEKKTKKHPVDKKRKTCLNRAKIWGQIWPSRTGKLLGGPVADIEGPQQRME